MEKSDLLKYGFRLNFTENDKQLFDKVKHLEVCFDEKTGKAFVMGVGKIRDNINDIIADCKEELLNEIKDHADVIAYNQSEINKLIDVMFDLNENRSLE